MRVSNRNTDQLCWLNEVVGLESQSSYAVTVNVTILEESPTLSAVTTIEYGRVLPSILGIGADVSVAVKVGMTASYKFADQLSSK